MVPILACLLQNILLILNFILLSNKKAVVTLTSFTPFHSEFPFSLSFTMDGKIFWRLFLHDMKMNKRKCIKWTKNLNDEEWHIQIGKIDSLSFHYIMKTLLINRRTQKIFNQFSSMQHKWLAKCCTFCYKIHCNLLWRENVQVFTNVRSDLSCLYLLTTLAIF